MTSDSLYHEALVRLARSAVGAGRLEAADATAALDNPFCGDEVTIDVRLRAGCIEALAHRVRGCLLCEAAASLLGRAAPGSTAAEVREAHGRAAAMLRSGEPPPGGRFADLALFAPARAVKSRHRCVLLPFEALAEALARAGGD